MLPVVNHVLEPTQQIVLPLAGVLVSLPDGFIASAGKEPPASVRPERYKDADTQDRRKPELGYRFGTLRAVVRWD